MCDYIDSIGSLKEVYKTLHKTVVDPVLQIGGQSSRPWDKGGGSPWPLPWIRHCKSFGDILIQLMRAHTDRSRRDLQSYLQSYFGKENTVKWTRTPERIHLASFAADIAKVQYASFEHMFMLWLLESRRHQYKVVVPRPHTDKNLTTRKTSRWRNVRWIMKCPDPTPTITNSVAARQCSQERSIHMRTCIRQCVQLKPLERQEKEFLSA